MRMLIVGSDVCNSWCYCLWLQYQHRQLLRQLLSQEGLETLTKVVQYNLYCIKEPKMVYETQIDSSRTAEELVCESQAGGELD